MIDTAAFEGRRIPPLLGRAALWGGAALCAVSLGWTAAPVIWRLKGEGGQIIPAASAAPDEPATQNDLEPILAFAPFGQDSMPAPEPQAAGESSLGLVLLGVTIGNPASASRAIISGGDTPVASYPVGARITANADLAEVNGDHVVLRVNGQPETLSFTKRPEAAAPDTGNNFRNLPPPAAGPRSVAPSGPASPLDETIARYRDALDADPSGLLEELGLAPAQGGYQIGANPGPELAQAGFLPGDVITLVNGRQVGDIDADRQHFDDIVASGQLRVELQRDGQAVAMSFLLQ